MLASEEGHAGVVKLLLNAEADVAASDKVGITCHYELGSLCV